MLCNDESARFEEICFGTSGSTGLPRRWFRPMSQIRQELDLIGDTLIGDVDIVINYAPPTHIFGALFGEWFPKVLDIPVRHAWNDVLSFPAVGEGLRVFIVCLPMSWNLLGRYWRYLHKARSIVALHGAARLPDAAHGVLRMAGGLMHAYEIFGSTETGAIAYRALAANGQQSLWQGFRDVSFVRSHRPGECALEALVVASPRIARPEGQPVPPAQYSTGDIVRFVATDTFHFVGRESSLIKVNGLRVNLLDIELALSKNFPPAAFAVVPVDADSLTGEGYAVFWSREASGSGAPDIHRALEGFPRPAAAMEVPAIPVTQSGKIDRHELLKLLDSRKRCERR
jgi:acyl-coenzyme A synthetase/AMP-(fatty) acid ligase